MGWDINIFLRNLPLALNATLGSILVIALILVTYIRLYSTDPYRRYIFCSLIVFCLAAIASDLLFLLFNGLSGRQAHSLLYVFGSLRYLFQALSCYYVMVFIDYMAFRRSYRSGRILKVVYIIVGAYAFMLLASYVFETYFHIDPAVNDVYRMCHTYVRLIINCGPILFALGVLLVYHYLFKRSQLGMFFTLLTLFMLGIVFDFLFSEARLVWPWTIAALLYAYFFVVQTYMFIDPLTEVGNRLSFNEFTDKLSRSATGEAWAIVMIDMDHFKQINDTLGHQEGDHALGYMAEIIKSCVKKDDFVARYGGDEFVLAVKIENDSVENIIPALMNEIQIVIDIFNDREICPFKLEISYGYDVYTADGRQTIEDFLNHIDALMYKNKHDRRRATDKKTDRAAEAAR